ncbi:uncharacterized protein [Maniola hyperantus]|uniref:uncharacterized protein n=1 Tax=Aphantopus hyperantus TaxID=2795564 RepID=UPI00374916B5
MNNKIMKLIVFTGNLLCVYRSYCSISFVRRCVVWVRILIELTVILAYISTLIVYLEENISRLIYIFLTLISSFCIVLLACYHCKDFKNLTKLIEENHAYFIKDKKYCENLNKKYKFVVIAMTAYTFLSLSLCINFHIIMYHSSIKGSKYMIYSIYTFICNIRYMFEYITLYSILFILSEQLNCITRSICKNRLAIMIETKQISILNYKSTGGKTRRDSIQEIITFEDWTSFYTNMKDCSNIFNTIFGVEITIVLATLIFYLIIFLYAIVYISINGSITLFNMYSLIIETLVLLIALSMLSWSAQTIQNSVDYLKRCLGRLLINSTEDLVSYKETKDLLRLISSRPIRTQAFGSIYIDMSLLPKFVMFFTSYTVIALQFNNVV